MRNAFESLMQKGISEMSGKEVWVTIGLIFLGLGFIYGLGLLVVWGLGHA